MLANRAHLRRSFQGLCQDKPLALTFVELLDDAEICVDRHHYRTTTQLPEFPSNDYSAGLAHDPSNNSISAILTENV
jgi:hypothetical protein